MNSLVKSYHSLSFTSIPYFGGQRPLPMNWKAFSMVDSSQSPKVSLAYCCCSLTSRTFLKSFSPYVRLLLLIWNFLDILSMVLWASWFRYCSFSASSCCAVWMKWSSWASRCFSACLNNCSVKLPSLSYGLIGTTPSWNSGTGGFFTACSSCSTPTEGDLFYPISSPSLSGSWNWEY